MPVKERIYHNLEPIMKSGTSKLSNTIYILLKFTVGACMIIEKTTSYYHTKYTKKNYIDL